MRMKLLESGVLGLGSGNLPNQPAHSLRRLSTFLNPSIKLPGVKPDFIIVLGIVRADHLQESSISR